MEEKIDKFLQIAEYLGDSSNIDVMNNLKNMIKTKKLYVSVLGQFSSGKSKLINNLLERDILPVRTTETTAVPTFIQYESQESVVFVEKSEKKIRKEVEDLKKFYHNSDEIAGYDFSNLYCIEMNIKNDLLKTGIIILDTPGVNTINKAHEEITESMLKLTGKAIYVLGKTVTQIDKILLNELAQNGIDCVYVRTRIDEIKSTEETVEEVVSHDKKMLTEIAGKEVTYFYLSNEKDSEWFKNIDKLGKYIAEEMAYSIEKQINQLIASRLIVTGKLYLKEIKNIHRTIQETENKDNEQTKAEKERLKEMESILTKSIDEKKKKCVNHCQSVKRDAEKFANDILEKHEYKYSTRIGLLKGELSKIECQNIVLDELADCAEQLKYYYIDEVAQINQEILLDFEKDLGEYEMDTYLTIDDLNIPSIETVDYDNECHLIENEISVTEQSIEKISSEINQMQDKLDNCANQLEVAKEITSSCKSQLESLEYQAPELLVEETEYKNSEMLANVGKVADIALLFLPVGEIKVAGDVAKGLKAADGVKDTMYASKLLLNAEKAKKVAVEIGKKGKVLAKNGKAIAEKAGLLDMLTFEHLFRKIGEEFDEPPRYYYDHSNEEEYKKQRTELEQKYKIEVEKKLMRKQEKGLIENEKQKNEERLRLEESKRKELEERLVQLKKKIQIITKQQNSEKIKEFYTQSFQKKGELMLSSLCDDYNEKIEAFMPVIIESYTKQFEEELKKNRCFIKIIESECMNNEGRAKEISTKCNEYRDFILNFEETYERAQ